MIQDTTLRMVVQAVDQATVPLDNVKRKLDDVTGGMDDARGKAVEALPQIGQEADDLSDNLDDLGESASGAAWKIGPGMIEAIALAGFAFVQLVQYIQDVIEEHTKLADVADRLDLPYDDVKNYSDAWIEVATSLDDAARGFKELGAAQAAALKSLGLSPGNQRENDRVRQLISIGEGTRQEKVDAFRILFGMSYDDAAKQVDEDMRNLLAVTNVDGRLVARYEQQGLTRGLNVSEFVGGLSTPNAFGEFQDMQREAERQRKEAVKGMEKEHADALRRIEQAEREHTKALVDEMRGQAAEFDRFMSRLKAGADELSMVQRMIDQKFSADSLDKMTKASGEAATETLKAVKLPFEDFTTAVKNGFDNIVRTGDISMKRLVANIIAELTRKSLFEAIDKLAEALSGALSGGSGKGGLLGFGAALVGGLFGGKAGGGRAEGWELVGEEGPEFAYFGAGGRVVNSRQAAFLGAGGGQQKQAPVVVNHNTYTISGVETQQVVAYIEQTRREDQRANLRMLERNGLGRMR